MGDNMRIPTRFMERTNSHLCLHLQHRRRKNKEENRGSAVAGQTISAKKGLSNGLVNGNGFINGVSPIVNDVRRLGPIKALKTSGLRGLKSLMTRTIACSIGYLRRSVSQRSIVSVMIALLFILPTGYLSLPPASSHSGIVIDGSISDWNGVPRQSLFGSHGILLESAMKTDGDTLYFYLKTMPFNGTEVVYGLFDSDGNPDTGYHYGNIGADYLVSIKLSQDGVISSGAAIYGSSTSTGNWSCWSSIGRVSIASNMENNSATLEVKIPSYIFQNRLSQNFRVIWQDRSVMFQ